MGIEFRQRQHGELFFGELHARAHQLVAAEHDNEIAAVADQRQGFAVGDLGGGKRFAGKHGLFSITQRAMAAGGPATPFIA